MDETSVSQASERPMDDTAERFERGDDTRALYEQMRPDQRTAIAGEFIRMLSLAGDARAEQFRQQFREHTQLTDVTSDGLLSADQVAALDSYVRQRHPEMIEEVLRHPVTQSSLDMPGVPADDEPTVSANQDNVMTPEHVATAGSAYATSWEETEQRGEEAKRQSEEQDNQQEDER